MHARMATIQETYTLAAVGVLMLLFYAGVQTALSTALSPQSDLKVVLESQLLLIGVILHVQWRSVNRWFTLAGQSRPFWIAAADCLSFVITFWALTALARAFWS